MQAETGIGEGWGVPDNLVDRSLNSSMLVKAGMDGTTQFLRLIGSQESA